MNVDLKSPPKRVSNTYGKKSIASSARRNGSFNSTPSQLHSSSSSDSNNSSDGDDSELEISKSLHLISGGSGSYKGKGKELNSLKHNKSFSLTPSRPPINSSQTTNTKTMTGSSVKLIVGGVKRKGSNLEEGNTKLDEDVEWDEGIASAYASSKASTSRLEPSKSTISRLSRKGTTPSPSPSPTKRPRPISVPTLEHSPIASNSSPVPRSIAINEERELQASPKQKKLKPTPNTSIPTIFHTSASSIRSSPNNTKPQPSSPSRSPTRIKSPFSTTPTSSKSPQPSPERQTTALIPSTTSTNPLLSPSKDLSSLFDMFDEKSLNNGKSDDVKKKVKTSAGLGGRIVSSSTNGSNSMAGIATRSPSKLIDSTLSTPHSPASLDRSASFPLMSPSTSLLVSKSNSLLPSNSLPDLSTTSPSKVVAPTRTYSRPPTLSTASNTLSRTESTALAPRGVGEASKRTYGGGNGGRSFKRDEEEDRYFGYDTGGVESLDSGEVETHNKNSLESNSTNGGRKSFLPSLLPSKPYREKESYSTLLSKWGIDLDEEQADFEDGNGGLTEGNQLKSIAHMRQKGETTRFSDEFDYLVEGLDGNGEGGMGIGVRRSSAIEVLRKMLETDFMKRLMASGFVERVFTDFRKAEAGDGDRVLDPALAFLIILLARDQRMAEPLFRMDTLGNNSESDVLIVLATMLKHKNAGEEIGATGIKGLSKVDARSLASLRAVIDKSTFSETGSFPITLRSLSTVALSLFASFTPRSIFRPQIQMCTSGALEAIIQNFLKDTDGLELRINKYESGLELLPADGSMNLDLIEASLRIIEACSLASPQESYLVISPHLSSLASTLTQLVSASYILSLNDDSKIGERAMDCLLSSLRMLVDMTTSHSEWSIALIDNNPAIISSLIKIIVASRIKDSQNVRFRRSGADSTKDKDGVEEEAMVEQQKEKESSVMLRFDLLCLALGVLTNLVETVDSTKDILRETLINPLCQETRKCAKKCQCLDRKTALYRLTDLYLDPLEDSLHELTTSFINGYSGILVGLIMLDAPKNQTIIVDALSNNPSALSNLMTAMEEFATLHDRATEEQEGVRIDQVEEVEATQVVEGNEIIVIDEFEGGEKEEETVAFRIRMMLEGLR